MKSQRLIFILFITVFHLLCKGQKNDFLGSIMYNDKKNRPCEMFIHIDSFYQVSGTIQRDIDGQTVSHAINGEFNPTDVTIYLREYALNKSDCPIFFQGKVFYLLQNIYSIAGIFKSIDSITCPSGHINVICRDFKFNLYPKQEKKQVLTEKEEEVILTNLLSQKIKNEVNFIQVRENDKVQIQAGADTLFLKIYDNQKVDGDRVRIEFNNIVVTENFPLSEEKSIFKLLPKKGVNILKIRALNEGRIALNTSKVEIYNHTLHEYFINILNKNQFIQYEIKN